MTTVTTDALRDRIAEQEAIIEEAEREIGVAVADGASTATAAKRLREARAELQSLQAGVEEVERREVQAAERERAVTASERRRGEYTWAADLAGRVEEYLRSRAELEQAKRQVLEIVGQPTGRRIVGLKRGLPRIDIDQLDLDRDLVRQLPVPRKRVRGDASEFLDLGRATPEQARELRARAEQLAHQESGEGSDSASSREQP